MAKGVPKTLTNEQRKFRAEQLAAARKKRHEKPKRTARRSNSVFNERDALLAAAKGIRDNWEKNLTNPMRALNAAIDLCEKGGAK